MNCPRCSLALTEFSYENVSADRCEKCRGVWLDEGELLAIVSTHEEKFPPALMQEVVAHAFAGLPPAVLSGAKVGACPKCAKGMRLLNYSYDSGVIIDRCMDAHGVWLDGGELEKIQAYSEQWEREAPKHREAWVKLVRDLKTDPELKPAVEVAKRMEHSTFMFRQFLSVFLGK